MYRSESQVDQEDREAGLDSQADRQNSSGKGADRSDQKSGPDAAGTTKDSRIRNEANVFITRPAEA